MKWIESIKQKIHEWNAARELRKYAPLLARDAGGLNATQLVELIYSPKWERFFWTKQVKFELVTLVERVERLKPKIVVEIGTNMGGTLFCFTKVADPAATIISIDLPGGLGGGGYPWYRRQFYLSFASPRQSMLLWREDSHSPLVKQRLQEVLQERPIDFLFLDGDHSYEGIKQDFEMYAPLVRSGGMIAFHDIKPSLPDNWIQVGRFWEEIKGSYEFEEIVDPTVNWGGIGILYQK